MYHKTVLDNGLRIMMLDMPYMESVALGVWIGIGGRYESKANSGISHFLEHMVFKGTKTRTTRDIKESIEGIGGSLNGFTDEEATCYLVKVPKKFVTLGLDVLSDMVIHPKVDRSDLDKERGVIFEEIKMYRDRPDQHVHQVLCELLWPDHPLGMPLIGDEKSLGALGKRELLDYRKRHYTPENVVICACGQLDKEAFVEEVKKRFPMRGNGSKRAFKKFTPRQKKSRFDCCERQTEQTHLNIGFHNVSRLHPDKYTSSVLHVLLGGNMSSRLFHEVRETRGLAYEIYTGIKHYSDTGAFFVTAGVDNKKLGRSIEIIMRELKKIKTSRVKDGEFQRAKDFYKGQLAMALEDTLTRMLWVGEKLMSNDINYNIDEVMDSIDLVTQDMVMDLARKIFKEGNMNVAIVGPLKKKDQGKIKSLLKL
ncbi:MAG: pitrilysin family protein [Candidatus Omnitrophota bacterium]